VSSISIVAINCPLDGDNVPTVQVSQWWSRVDVRQTVDTSATSILPGVHRLDFELAPGDWFIHVTVAGKDYCGSFTEVTILEGHPRHLVFPRLGEMIIGPSCSVAGRLPALGLSVRLVSRTGHNTPVYVDGDAYYSGEFSRGMYTLEVGAMPNAYVDIPIDFSTQPSGEFCEKKIVRDVTLADLRSAK
jgi:hypothetical protein